MKVTINQSKCMHSSEIKGLNLIKLSSEMLQLNSIFFPFSFQDNGIMFFKTISSSINLLFLKITTCLYADFCRLDVIISFIIQ